MNFSFNISPSNEYSGLISFRIDWLALLVVQGTHKSWVFSNTTVQKASVLRCSSFFMVQVSHPYMTTGKIIVLTIWTLVSKVMSLLLNMLSRLVIAFLPRSKHVLVSWLQLPSVVILPCLSRTYNLKGFFKSGSPKARVGSNFVFMVKELMIR